MPLRDTNAYSARRKVVNGRAINCCSESRRASPTKLQPGLRDRITFVWIALWKSPLQFIHIPSLRRARYSNVRRSWLSNCFSRSSASLCPHQWATAIVCVVWTYPAVDKQSGDEQRSEVHSAKAKVEVKDDVSCLPVQIFLSCWENYLVGVPGIWYETTRTAWIPCSTWLLPGITYRWVGISTGTRSTGL